MARLRIEGRNGLMDLMDLMDLIEGDGLNEGIRGIAVMKSSSST